MQGSLFLYKQAKQVVFSKNHDLESISYQLIITDLSWWELILDLVYFGIETPYDTFFPLKCY